MSVRDHSGYDARLMGRWPIAGVALTAACSGTEPPAFLDLGDLDRELVVLAALDADDQLLATGFIDFAARSDSSTRILLPAGGRLVGAGFDRSGLAARAPRLDPERLSEFGFASRSQEASTCPEGVLRPDEVRAQIPWPEATRAFEWLGGEEPRVDRDVGADWWSRVSPLVPVRADRCGGHPTLSLRPFASNTPVLAPGSVIDGQPLDPSTDGLSEFVRLDERFVLVAYGRYLVLAEHELGFVDQPGRSITLEPGWRARSVAVGAPDADTGVRRIALIAVLGASEDEGANSRLFEATLDGETLRLVRILKQTMSRIDGVYVRPEDNRIVLYERPDQIYLENADRSSVDPVAVLPGVQLSTNAKRGRLLPSGIAEMPMVIVGSRASSVYLGSADAHTWTNVQEGLTLGSTIRAFTASTRRGGETWLYAGNGDGQVFEREFHESRWRTIAPRLDPSLIEVECAATELEMGCGFAGSRFSWLHLTAFDDRLGQRAVFAMTDFCSVAFVVRPDGCTSSLRMDALGAIIRSADDEIFAARSEAGFVTVATELGHLYELSWAELGLQP